MKLQKLAEISAAALLTATTFSCTKKAPEQKPNIVWIMMEDWGYQLSCYGEKGIQTLVHKLKACVSWVARRQEHINCGS